MIDALFIHFKNNGLDQFKKSKCTLIYLRLENLMDSGDYNWAMFLGHLVIEKLLKAVYVKTHNGHAIHGHDLLRLTASLELELDPIKEEWLDQITTFNLNARYDNYKQDFLSSVQKNLQLGGNLKLRNYENGY